MALAALPASSPWGWHAHPDVWLLVLALLGGYLAALRLLGPRHVAAGEPAAPRRQVALFCAGVLTLWVAADWPMHDLSEDYWYSSHMVQHLLLSLVAAPLMLLGTPAWMLRALLRPRALMAAARVVTRPLPALAIFNAVLVFTHWPVIVTAAVRSEAAHFATHSLLFLAALIMWTPVASPLLELPRLSYPGRMLYLFLQSLVPTVPASFLTFGSQPLYHIYESAPRLYGVSALADQRVAGLIMKIVGGLLLWGVIAALFFRWYSVEQAEGVDVIEWHDVDRALNRTGLPRR